MVAKSQIWRKEKRKMNSHALAENRQKEESRSTFYLFTRRHQVLVGLEDVSESFFDVFLFHARQHCGRQEQRQTPLLPADAQKQKRKKRSLIHYDKQSINHSFPVIDLPRGNAGVYG